MHLGIPIPYKMYCSHMDVGMAIERNQDAYKPKFFKVLLQESLKKLFIPPKFTKHLVNRNYQKAAILSPLGKFWHVSLQREGREMFFGSGWEEFVQAHGLSVGHFLVFHYEGNMVFTINIFEKSGCLKQYDSTASTYVDDEILDHAPKVKKGRKNPKSSKRVPYFDRIIKHYNVTSMRIAVPKVFCLSNGLTTVREITLKDGRQRLWPVLFRLRSREGCLGKGWRSFSVANNVKEGDKCIFKLVSKKVMVVRIVRG